MRKFAANACYNINMPVNTEKKSETVLINLTPSAFKELAKIAQTEDRPVGYVARELMARGLAQYQHDGRLRDLSLATANGVKGNGSDPAVTLTHTKIAPVGGTGATRKQKRK